MFTCNRCTREDYRRVYFVFVESLITFDMFYPHLTKYNTYVSVETVYVNFTFNKEEVSSFYFRSTVSNRYDRPK